jgi:hypothetical protein
MVAMVRTPEQKHRDGELAAHRAARLIPIGALLAASTAVCTVADVLVELSLDFNYGT